MFCGSEYMISVRIKSILNVCVNVSLFRFNVTMYEEWSVFSDSVLPVNRAMFLYVTKAENRPYEDLEDEDVVKSSLSQKARDLAIP